MAQSTTGDKILLGVCKPMRNAPSILTYFWLVVVLLIAFTSIVSGEEVSINCPEGIRMVHCYGPFVQVTLGTGDVDIYDTAGVQICRHELELEYGDFCTIIPSDSLLVVVRSQGGDDGHFLSDWIEDLFVGGSSVELINLMSGRRIFWRKFAGDPAHIAYDSGSGLLSVSVIEESGFRVVLLNVASGEVLSEVDGGRIIRDVLLDDSTLYIVGLESIRRYTVHDDGRLARAGTDLFDCRFNLLLAHSYYDCERRRLAIYNDCMDSLVGPISLVKVGSVAQGIRDLVPGQDASGWAWHYRHETGELFVNHIGEMLYVANLMTNEIDSFRPEQLRSTEPVKGVIPLESGRCLILPGERGELCTSLLIVDSEDILGPAH